MKIVVLAVGAAKSPGLAAAIREYETRVGRYFKFEVVEVRGQRITARRSEADVIESDSDELLARVPEGLDVVVVDERGDSWSSEALAAYLSDLAVLGKPGAAFLIGGAFGLSGELRRRADKVLSMSSFTLPHELARLVLTEQLYRAGTIQRGEPYHKGG